MCAIVDVNVLGEVFGSAQTEAGKYFYDWLDKRRGILVTGGKLKDEADKNANFANELRERIIAGRARQVPDADVDAETVILDAMNVCESDDEHILALARVSDTRILFTNDDALQNDFRNPSIINNPRGQIYTTAVHTDVRRVHKNMLSPKNVQRICRHCRNRS